MSTAIRFGTDGWRAIIAEDYTFANVRVLATALAAYVKRQDPQKAQKGIAIGYDTRFMSADFALAAAEAIAAAGVPVRLADRDCPTPTIFWAVRNGGLASGVMITASHNPPRYNGFKFVSPQGGPADKDATNAVEALLGQQDAPGDKAAIEEFDPRPDFEAQLHRVIDFDLLKKNPGSAVCDFVHGTGRGYVDALLRECGWNVSTIRGQPDPMFGGILPDPANPACHNSLQAAVSERSADLGLANDPDADRFGIVDSTGEYITPNQVLALVYVHLLQHRGLQGAVARTVATTHLLDAIAQKHGQECLETPVGFKWLGAALEEGAILAGEESGGMSIGGHLPGKDGVLADLLAAEIWALHRKPLSVLYQELLDTYGAFYSTRIDLHLEPAAKDALIAQMRDATPDQIAGAKVANVVTKDGLKLNLEDGSWLLLRPSGTEPLVRVYLEARSEARLHALQDYAKQFGVADH